MPGYGVTRMENSVWINRAQAVGVAFLMGIGLIVGTTTLAAPGLLQVAVAEPAADGTAAEGSEAAPEEEAAPDPGVPAPADVAAAALLPGMDPAKLMLMADGSLQYHGTTPVGMETPGWSVIGSAEGPTMVHGPVAPKQPAAAEAGPVESADSDESAGSPLPAESALPAESEESGEVEAVA